jgi:hypothetical protein
MSEKWSPFNEVRFRIECKVVGWIPWLWLCHYFMCLLYPEDINEGGGVLWFLKL